MAQEVTNFARFYAAINALPQVSDKDEFKRQVVMQYTWNRTDSLREMTRKEYSECCYALERLSGLTEKEEARAEHLSEADARDRHRHDRLGESE